MNPKTDLAGAVVDHWKEHARQWSLVRPPLRPSAEDLAFTTIAIENWTRQTRRNDPKFLVLGVTPEICNLESIRNHRLIAVDKSRDMIRAMWREKKHLRHEATCADWREMPMEDASVDIVLADGSFSALPFPNGYDELCAELRRVLVPGGQCVIRCFMQPLQRETVKEVFAELESGTIGNFHVLKWRLAMALQPNSETGVAVGNIWTVLNQVWPNLDLLAERFGWPEEEVRTIEVYRGVETCYTFPNLEEYFRCFDAAGFDVLNLSTPTYELGESCPTLVLKPR